MKKSKILIVSLILLLVVTVSIFANNTSSDDYGLIQQAVKSQSMGDLAIETNRRKATECYPEAGKSAICKQIQYKFASGNCAKIVSKLQGSSSTQNECKPTIVSRTYKNAQLTYYISSQDGEDILLVTLVSKD